MKKLAKAVIILGALFSLTGCAGSPTFLSPKSSIAAEEASLFWILIYLSIAVFAIVEGLLLFNIIRFRKNKGDQEIPRQVHGNTRLEILWTAIPIFLVAGMFVLTIRTVNAVAPPRPAQGDLNVLVVGHRWWWEYDYPDLDIITANELHVPIGTTVRMDLVSEDVIHSFWIPQLAGKIDVIPGHTNEAWFVADEIGTYLGQCAEFCGLNHANMRIVVVVESQEDFDAWVTNQQQPPVAPQNATEEEAYDMITEGICSNCHVLGGIGSEHPVGPNLTHLYSRSVFAGATYDLTEENLRRWLTDNEAMKPGNAMSVNLTPEDVDALTAYLTRLE